MEILDIVNEKDEVIGQASYDEIHEKKLLHRVVHVLLVDKKKNVLLQLRSAQKSAYPLHWSFSVGGHVQSDETYENALIREAQEELGITFSPTDFLLKGEGAYVSEAGHHSYYRSYEAIYDQPLDVKNDEVETVRSVSWDQLKHMVVAGEEKIHPEMIAVLKKYWSQYF